MQKIIMSPSRYVQGAGEVSKLPEHVGKFGTSALVLMSGTMMRTKADELKASFEAAGIKFTAEKFNGEGSFPLVVILDKNGKVLGKMGFKNVSPEEYIKMIHAIDRK